MFAGAPSIGAPGFEFYEPIRPCRPLQVIAHRGAAGQAPANSRSALIHCIEDGLEWASVDVWRTRDGRHVLAQNAHVPLGGALNSPISEHTLAELALVDCGAAFASRFTGEHLLSLREALVLCKGKLNLSLNCHAIDVATLVSEILEAQMERQVVVSPPTSELTAIQQLSHGRIALMAKWLPTLPMRPWIASNALTAVEIDAAEFSLDAAHACHELGTKVLVNVLGRNDNPASWERAFQAGADWIQTDLPEEVVAHGVWRRVSRRPVRISLHRGANRYAPENTLPALDKAIRLGADFVELDVRTTNDGQFFLLHDATLDDTTEGKGEIASLPAQAIQALSAGVKFSSQFAAVHLPTLEEFFMAAAGRMKLYIDAKAITPEALAAVLHRFPLLEDSVVYQSVPYLVRLKKLAPKIRALPPLRSPEQLAEIADRVAPFAVDADWSLLSRDLIARCHALGIQVFSDALGDHETVDDYLKALDWGIDLIQTDHPLRVLRALELRSAK